MNDKMKRMSVNITPQQMAFLTDRVMFEDAGKNLSEAVQWCIDSCMRIEARYGIDACFIGFNDIRLPENQGEIPITIAEKRRSAKDVGFDDFCEAHDIPYNNECGQCAELSKANPQ